MDLIDRVGCQLEDDLEGKLVFKGRPVIHRDSRIDGGICAGGRQRECIVVDFDKDWKLQEMYDEIVSQIGNKSEREILKLVYDTVDRTLKHRSDAALDRFLEGMMNDTKIPLGNFLIMETGQCRHAAAACAALTERLCDERYLNGKTSLDRNKIKVLNFKGAHAWCRYTSADGEVTILDAMLHHFGGLPGKTKKMAPWEYRRPEEMKVKNYIRVYTFDNGVEIETDEENVIRSSDTL